MSQPPHDPGSKTPTPTPADQAGGSLRLIVAVLGLALGVAFIALLVFGGLAG